jgi:ornithine cyclodeaminase/alanine dehydrogenase-like protein (mu-crystallin family)
MPKIFNRDQIERALEGLDVTAAIEEGFIAYSAGKTVVPPVGELVFEVPPPATSTSSTATSRTTTTSSSRWRRVSMAKSSSTCLRTTA